MEEVYKGNITADVVVIGAGASGIVTAKWMREAGYNVLILERSNALGGAWQEGVTNTRHSLFSKENFRFSDLNYPDGTPEFPSRTDVARYLREYAHIYNLEQLIHFNRDVRHMERIEGGRWKVTAVRNNILEFFEAKYVAVTTGYQNEPNIPYIPGMETFKGESCHSSKVHEMPWNRLDNRRVVIVGLGNSAVEIADQAASRCQSIHLSSRSNPWLMPSYLFGHPYDRYSNRISRVVPWKVRQYMLERSITVVNGHQKRWKVEPKKRILSGPLVVGQTILHNVRNGKVKMATNIDHVDGSTVYFEDGTHIQADLIIFCTGYTTDCTCLDGYLKSVVTDPEMGSFKLYKDVFSPEIGSSIAFIGFLEATALGGLIVAETQARWWVKLSKGELTLPVKEIMEDSVASDVVGARKLYGANRCLKLRDGLRYCDEISSLYGAKPTFFTHPSLALRLLFSCGGATQYRIQGPDAQIGAPEQVALVPIPEALLWIVIGLVLLLSWFFFASTATILEFNDLCDDCLWDD